MNDEILNNANRLRGEMELYSSERYVDFKATLEDATKFGEEICRRFNQFPQEQKL